MTITQSEVKTLKIFKVKEEKLSEIPFDTFITNFFFKIAAKTVYKKELGL